MTKNDYDPKDGPLLSPYEEMLRSRAAGELLRERVRQDPAYARQLLEEIGYFEMMADEAEDNHASVVENSLDSNGVDSA